MSAEAVEWFMERDIRTMKQSLSFVPWVIQKGMKEGTVTESTDSVCECISCMWKSLCLGCGTSRGWSCYFL